jgi:Tfp pilus assembly protein PilV
MRLNESGFALPETMAALLIVALMAMLVVRSSGANALMRTQLAARATAASLAAELSEWSRRRGEALLGSSLAEALAAEQPVLFCDDGACNAGDGARYYIAEWKRRLQQAIPDARVEVCIDHPPATAALRWECEVSGSTKVLKLGWPSHPGAQRFRPAIMVELGSAG